MRSLGLRKFAIQKEMNKRREEIRSDRPPLVSNGNIAIESDPAILPVSDSSSSEHSSSVSILSLDLEDITDRLTISVQDAPASQQKKSLHHLNSVWNLIGGCARRADTPPAASTNGLSLLSRVMFVGRNSSIYNWSDSVTNEYPTVDSISLEHS